MNLVFSTDTRRKAVWGPRCTGLAALLAFLTAAATAAIAGDKNGASQGGPNAFVQNYKMDRELADRANEAAKHPGLQTTPVIIEFKNGAQPSPELRRLGRLGARLDLINGQVIEVRNVQLKKLAGMPEVFRLHYDRPTQAHNYRTAVTVGARAVQNDLGFNGNNVGVAIIDSGITSWHDDLTNKTGISYPFGNQRVAAFVDFVSGQTTPYDDNGHGTHVAGIIAGNGYDSNGEKAGIAPRAAIVSLKVLDANGCGTISQIIAALNWVVTNAKTYKIKVVN